MVSILALEHIQIYDNKLHHSLAQLKLKTLFIKSIKAAGALIKLKGITVNYKEHIWF